MYPWEFGAGGWSSTHLFWRGACPGLETVFLSHQGQHIRNEKREATVVLVNLSQELSACM